MFFHSSRIRTLVAVVTNSSYRLIMGKEEIVFFLFHLGSYLEFLLTEMLIE